MSIGMAREIPVPLTPISMAPVVAAETATRVMVLKLISLTTVAPAVGPVRAADVLATP